MKLSELREAIKDDTIVNDLEEDDVAMAFVGTDKDSEVINVKGYVDGSPDLLSVLLLYCMKESEEFCKVVVNAVRMYNLHNISQAEKEKTDNEE